MTPTGSTARGGVQAGVMIAARRTAGRCVLMRTRRAVATSTQRVSVRLARPRLVAARAAAGRDGSA